MVVVNLVATLVVRNELGRYLEPCVTHLLEFCDEVRVLDDGSTDGTLEYLRSLDRVSVKEGPAGGFFDHEGRTRQALLQWALEAKPTHVLATDADEYVEDGIALRGALMSRGGPWSMCMREVWKADKTQLTIRQDGGWCEHPVAVAWAVPSRRTARLAIADRALACGRIPVEMSRQRAIFTDLALYHFGWAKQSERQQRWERYAKHDGGKYHRSAHLDSILWPDSRITTTTVGWDPVLGWLERAC